MDFFDVVVIGAGPAGSVAAAYLQKLNRNVLVLEKEIFPRFVIGESLLPNCMEHLEESGLLNAVMLADFQIKTGATFYNENSQCSFNFSDQFSASWSWTWQVKRAEFDKILIDEVQRKGVKVNFNCTVTEVSCSKNEQLITYKNPDRNLNTVRAKHIIDASGFGRVLPRLFDLNTPSTLIPRGAIFTHVKDENRSEKAGNNIFVHAFNNNSAWIWAIPFSDGTTSVGVVSENELIKNFSANNATMFSDFINSFNGFKGRFTDAEQLFEPKNILGYSVGVKQKFGEGYILCGNSTEFLDPIFSSGVTLATASGLKAAKLVDKHLSGETVNWQTAYEDIMKEGIEVFRSYVNAWYNGNLQTIFFTSKIKNEFKQQICSVLAGYVWDRNNPFIKKHKTILKTLAKVISIDEANKSAIQK